MDSYLKCYGCERFVYFTSEERLATHQEKTGHVNDQKSISKWAEYPTRY